MFRFAREMGGDSGIDIDQSAAGSVRAKAKAQPAPGGAAPELSFGAVFGGGFDSGQGESQFGDGLLD